MKRVALVTGGNRGLGFETCRQLAQAGLRVVLASRRREDGERAAAELRRDGLDVQSLELDVSRPESIERAAGELLAQGGVDVLVNNAGILPDSKAEGTASIFDTRWDLLQSAMATNALGPALLCKHLVPGMRERGYGRVVNVSSGMGQLAEMNGGWPAYRMSKAALNALTRIVADEVRGTNVLVNSVCPGWVRTEMGGPNATRSVQQGVETIVWLALLPDGGPSGGFFRDKKSIPW